MAKIIRHGDVLIIPVARVKGEIVAIKRDERLGVVLAYGETTGHAHHLTDMHVTLFEPRTKCQFFLDNGTELQIDTVGGGTLRVLEVSRDATLLHHDHGIGIPDGVTELPTPVEQGAYVVIRQRERSFSEIEGYRRVTD